MAFTLPFAYSQKRLSAVRPPSSLFGAYTMCSFLGVLIINFAFLCLGLGLLNLEDFYQCRKWSPGSISNPNVIGDNYESSVIFIVSGAQYVSSAMAFNFGYKFRASWLYNWRFLMFCTVYITLHFVSILHPSSLSCFYRLNCDAEHTCPQATDISIPTQIYNPWNTTIMPMSFRKKLLAVVIGNAFATMAWEYFVIYGYPARFIRQYFPRTKPLRL